MQINSVINSQIIQHQQNFKGSSANSNALSSFPSHQPVPLETSKAYVSPQITQPYKELETFDVPYIGKGKLYELANGHKIILVPKASKTYISTIVGAGFSDESAEKKDIAHLSEHLLANYWHNASQTSDIAKILSETGAYSNASTGNCSTTYHISANVQDNDDLESLMKIQLGTLNNADFSEEQIQKEKNIIIEEAKENGYFTNEERIGYNQSLKNLFNLDNLNGSVTEHTAQKIDNIIKQDLDKFFSDFYRPDNMTTIVVGNVDDNSIKTISKYLNKMQNPKFNTKRKNNLNINEDAQIQQSQRTDLESQDQNNKYWNFTELSFIGPKVNNQKDTENLIVLNKIIKNRLNQKNVNVEIGIPSVSSDKNVPQVIDITGKYKKDDVENNIKIIYSTIDDLVKNQISSTELNKAKEQVFENLSSQLEDNKALATFLNDILLSNPKMDIKSSFEYLKTISTIDMQNVAKKYLDLNKSSLVVVHPNKSAEISFKGLAELADTKDIKEYDLPNNLHVIFDSRPGIVKTAISCQFLYEGKQKNNQGIIDAMQWSLVRNENEEFPAGSWVDKDGINIRKFGSSDNIQNIINDVKNELINPEFKNQELVDSKKSQKELLDKEKNIYPNDLLEISSIPQKESGICPDWVTTNDLKTYYNRLLKNAQGTIIITIPKEKLEKLEHEIVKSLSELPTVKPHDFTKISNQIEPKDIEKNSIFLNKNDTSDKVKIEKKFKIINNGNIKDEASIILLNSILSSQLEKTLRGDLGLTYAAYSTFEKHNSKFGVMTLATEIAKAPLDSSTKSALSQMDNILNQLATSKIDKNILNSAKKQIKSNLLIPAETSVDRNINLESAYGKSYDINHSQKLAENLDSITSKDIEGIAQKLLEKYYVLEISGNKNAIEASQDYLSSTGEIIN